MRSKPVAETSHSRSANWAELIDRARRGCDDALGEILQSVRSYLVLVAESKLGERVQSKFGASDIVQHSMIEARESMGQFAGQSEVEFRSWIRKIVVNNLTDEVRRYTSTQARNVSMEVPEECVGVASLHVDEKTPSWHLARKEFDFRLAEAVSRLPSRQRYVIEARHKRGCSYQDIAAQLEISEEAARKIWSRAARQLKSLMDLPQ